MDIKKFMERGERYELFLKTTLDILNSDDLVLKEKYLEILVKKEKESEKEFDKGFFFALAELLEYAER